MEHKPIELGYSYDALEPFIDSKTMQIHYEKHHAGYANKLNTALVGHEELQAKSVVELLKNLNAVSEEIREAVKNNAGGVENHNLFFSILKKDVLFNPGSDIGREIISKFNSFEDFKNEFTKAATTLFGSGWAWLVLDGNELKIIQTKDQDSPINRNMAPLLGLDVWEHAYYLKHQNRRAEYVDAFWNVINWKKVNELFLQAKS